MHKYFLVFIIFILYHDSFTDSNRNFVVQFLNGITARLAERQRINSLPELNTANRVRSRGYPFEAHDIVTEDGYRLQLHRIPYGARGILNDKPRPAVLLNHGTFQSSLDWVINYNTSNCLGFLLADAGYDVWIANSRGNVYSHTHENYTIQEPAYWNFSQHEMGIYDLPAMIDHILKTTNELQIYYIGYSISASTYMILLSEKPEYNSKIRFGMMMAPAVYIQSGRDFKTAATFLPKLTRLQKVFGAFPIPGESIALFSNFGYIHHLCEGRLIPTKSRGFCWLYRKRNEGHFQARLPIMDQYSVISSNLFTATSSKTIAHLLQWTKSGRFRHYDYGKNKNLELYQRPTPFEYNLANVIAPTSLLYGPRDSGVVAEDVKLLGSKLTNLQEIYRVPNDKFAHVDFSYSHNANNLVYNHLLEIMDKN